MRHKVIILKSKMSKSRKPESHCPRESACSARTTCGLRAVQVMILFHDQCWAGSELQLLITSTRGRLSLVAEGHGELCERSSPVSQWYFRVTCRHLPVKCSWALFSSPNLQRVTWGSWLRKDFSVQLARVWKAGHLCFMVSARSQP